MSNIPETGPFNYGFGNKPAHFAGRKVELKDLFKYLNSIIEETDDKGRLPKGTKTPYMIIGPRGVGKTNLLNKALFQAESLGIECYKLVKKDFNNNFGRLVSTLSKKNYSFIEKNLDEININLTEIINFKIKPGRGDTILEEIFEINLQKAPMLLLCDEAHEYNPEDFGDFVNFIQILIGNSYPIAVVFAGTPQLTTVLRNIDASFIDRIRFIEMNRLNHDESIEAIKVPLNEYNIDITDDVLNLIVKEADDYPYFLQIIGSMLWDLAYEKNLSVIDDDTANKAIENSLPIRNKFYSKRYKEIQKSVNYKLLVNIIDFIKGNGYLVELKEIMDFLRDNYSELNFSDAYEELVGLGVIWEIDTTITPGISSFFDFILMKEGKL